MGSSTSYFGIYITIAVIVFLGYKRYVKRGSKNQLKDAVDRFKRNQ